MSKLGYYYNNNPNPSVPRRADPGVIVMTLRRTPLRMEQAAKRLTPLGLKVQMLWATDGGDWETAQTLPRDPRTPHIMQPGEVGICMSWWRAAAMIVRQDLPWAIVCEDDALPLVSASELCDLIHELPQEFDIALLHNQHEPPPEMEGNGHTKHFRRVKRCSHVSVAMLITNAGARKILRDLAPFDRPWDVWLRDNEMGMAIYQPQKGLGWFEQDWSLPSTVRFAGGAGTIPRILHRIWVGARRLPEEYERYWQGWKEHHPGWEFRTWSDAEISREWPGHEALRRAATPAAKSDVARFLILARFGGLYVDTDFECFRNFEPLLDSAAVLIPDMHEGIPCNGLLASVPEHPLICEMAQEAVFGTLAGQHILEAAGPAMVKRITQRWMDTFTKPFKLDGKIAGVSYGDTGLVISKPWMLFPYYWTDVRPPTYGDAWAAHHWCASWWGEREWRAHLEANPQLIHKDKARIVENLRNAGWANDAIRQLFNSFQSS